MEILIRQRSSFPKQKLRLKFSPRDLSVRNAGPSWRMLTKRWGLRQKLNTKRQITSKLEQHKNFIQPSNECRWEKCAESSRSALISNGALPSNDMYMYIIYFMKNIKMSFKHKFYYLISNKISSWFRKQDRFKTKVWVLLIICQVSPYRYRTETSKCAGKNPVVVITRQHDILPSSHTKLLHQLSGHENLIKTPGFAISVTRAPLTPVTSRYYISQLSEEWVHLWLILTGC